MTEFKELPRGLPGSSAYARNASVAPRALWSDPALIASSDFWDYERDKVFLGRVGENYIGIKDDRHLFTVAGSRTGKGRSAIVPNLMLYPGSALVLDPKGENASLTAKHRSDKLGQNVYVLDPYNVSNVPKKLKAGYNPLSQIDVESPYFIDDCATLAEGLVLTKQGDENNHWNSTARLILRGLITYAMSSSLVNNKSLNGIIETLKMPTLSGKGDGFRKLLEDIIQKPEDAHGVPAEMASLLLATGENEYGSLLSTVRQNLAFAASPPMVECLNGGSRSPKLADWKRKPTTIYLCLPASLLHSHGRFFRVFLSQLLSAVERVPEKPDIPALMLLDEMHVLGHMSIMETAAGLFAGYGVKLWSFWQDLSQLQSLYGNRWQTFIGNAGLIQAFGANDMATLEFLSNRLGGSSILSVSRSELTVGQRVQGFSGESKSIQQSSLLSPDEVAYFFSRQSENQLLIYPGADPIFIQRENYDAQRFQNLLG